MRRCRLLLASFAAQLAVGCGVETLEVVGTVERKSLELAAPISEVIVEIPVVLGARVEAGQVVVQLDATVAAAEIEAAEASHAAAQAAFAEAEGDFSRIAGLRRARVASDSDFDRARRVRDEARAVVAERAARVAQARKHLEDLTVRSYAGGVVDQLPFEVGERAPAGGVVAVVQAEEDPWVRVWLPAGAVGRIGADTLAEVEVEGIQARFGGRVEDIAREPEFTPHFALTERQSGHLVYRARVRLEGAPRDLRPGLPARVRLPLSAPGAGS